VSWRPGPQTVAIAAHKGGVGKTTTALALAAGLARSGVQVLLIDLDPQGHSTLGLGVELEGDVLADTARELFVEDAASLAHVTHRTAIEGLSIVPATIRLERAAQWLYARPMRHRILSDALRPAIEVKRFDWVVIDTPPSLGPLVENAVVAADRVIIPCRMEARAADGLVDLLDVIGILRPEFDQWRVLRTQRDARSSVTNAAIDAALEPWADRMLETVIPRSEMLNQAQIARVDIYQYAPPSAGALAYTQLCGEVRGWAATAVI
jgi:chromosome partitioning protein